MLAHAGSVDETWSVVMVFAALWAGWAGWSRLKDRGFPRLPRAGAYGLMGLAGLLVLGALFLPRAIRRTAAACGGPAHNVRDTLDRAADRGRLRRRR